MRPSLSICIVFGCLLQGVQSARWISSIQDGDELFLCVGANITLPWQYALSPGEEIIDVQWLYNGASDELIAMLSHGHFIPLPAFAGNRIEQVNNGGIVVNNAAVDDSGNYTVEVQGYDGAGDHFLLLQTVVVHISDGLMTQDGGMHVQQTSEAVLNQDTDQWSIQLTCGLFNFRDSPLFYVEWTTPDGTSHNSTDFSDGNFHLLLDNPVKGGNYTCRVPPHHLADACLHGNFASQGEATLAVDKVDSRLTLLEKENEQLKHVNSDMKNSMDAMIVQLQTENQQLKNNVSAMASQLQTEYQQWQSQYQQLRDENSVMKNSTDGRFSQLQTVDQQLQSKYQQLEDENNLLRSNMSTVVSLLQTEDRQLEQRIGRMETARTRQVSFHAAYVRSPDPSSGTPLMSGTVETNEGNAYSNTTGNFTAPYPGTYLFIATAGILQLDAEIFFDLYVDDRQVDSMMVYDDENHGTFSTLHSIVNLSAGQTVWIKSRGTSDYMFYVMFSGVLLHASL